MSRPEPKFRRAEVFGEILPGGMYDTDTVLRRTGIGEEKLHELRQSGELTTYGIPGYSRNWFRGEDILALYQPKGKTVNGYIRKAGGRGDS